MPNERGLNEEGRKRKQKKSEEAKEKYNKFRKGENQRNKCARKKRIKNMNKTEIIEYRRKVAERKRRSRQKLKDLHLNSTPVSIPESPSSSTPYRSNQSFGKAVKRTKIALPFSPRK